MPHAQRLTNNAGKVLRMEPDGTVPGDNPFPSSYIFAYGIRNSFGFTFDPRTGRLWETDNGPECNDELNLVKRGRNLGGGPSATCTTPPAPPASTNQDGPNPLLPKRWYATPLAVTGAAFCMSCRLGSASERALFVGTWVTHEVRLARLPSDPLPAERLFVGTCVTHEVRRALLTRRRNSIASQSVVHRHGSGVLAFARGPDGRLYFSDSAAIYRLTLSGKTRHQSEQCDARHRSGRVGNGSLDDLARGCRKRFASPNSEIGAKNLCRPA